MINRSPGDYAYTMVDLEEEITDENDGLEILQAY